MLSLRRRPRGLPAIFALPVGFSPNAAIRPSLAHIVAQATAGCIAARMAIPQAGLDGTAQVTGQDIARWMESRWPAVAGIAQATAHPAGDECEMGIQPCGFPPQVNLPPAASNSHTRLPADQRDGQVNLPPGESSSRCRFVVHRAGLLSLAGRLRRRQQGAAS